VTIRVVVADDQAVVRAGFRAILESEEDIEVVAEAAAGAAAVVAAQRLRPDVVLMDVRMPVSDGIAATRSLAGHLVPDPMAVLVVTTFDLDEYIFAALRTGASGFLLKDTEPDELVTAVRVVASGDGLVAPAVTRRLIAEFARVSAPPPPTGADPLADLTEREREILLLVAKGLSNTEIADALVLSASTVKPTSGIS
jgi:DNA-binding NarL/FixJ family response regulator